MTITSRATQKRTKTPVRGTVAFAGGLTKPEKTESTILVKDARTGSIHGALSPKAKKAISGLVSKTKVRAFSKDFATGLFKATPTEFITSVKKLVPAAQIEMLATTMGISRESLYGALKIPASTVTRKVLNSSLLSQEQSERVLGIERLIGQVQVMVSESGDATNFSPGLWLGAWINREIPALDGAKPLDYLDTVTGQLFIARLLSQMQSGAYA